MGSGAARIMTATVSEPLALRPRLRLLTQSITAAVPVWRNTSINPGNRQPLRRRPWRDQTRAVVRIRVRADMCPIRPICVLSFLAGLLAASLASAGPDVPPPAPAA